ncbi:eukaryotic translation initiation factor 4G-like [Chrysoperla carnea]|uniref:eukaryotic translation initiation factor 4G-like n=1 Tax=Chrysoperla carnea TaxID=189513 RepID=UPI001D0745E2|nr:eukaryotic translation initiation factor 4G-like [Chrysoperla carnea]
MKAFVLVATLVVVVQGRPEAGYSYSGPAIRPSGSYGAPGVGASIGGGFGHGLGSGIGSGNGGGYSSGFGNNGHSQIGLVQKHVYLHVPPPEPVEYKPPKPVVVPAPQKHYKIIFIKAPTPPTPTAPVIPVIPQNEEKTLVYVLVKKPEEQPEIVIPTAAPTQPAKPEVYFIRYKTQKEGDGATSSGISGGHGVSTGASALSQSYGPPDQSKSY